MRTAILLLAVACLAIAVPVAEAAPGSGSGCELRPEYVTGASLDPSDPEEPVEPGYYTLIECYY